MEVERRAQGQLSVTLTIRHDLGRHRAEAQSELGWREYRKVRESRAVGRDDGAEDVVPVFGRQGSVKPVTHAIQGVADRPRDIRAGGRGA